MADDNFEESRWRSLWRIPRSRLMLGIPVGGFALFVAGVVFWGGFNWSMELTSTETFCVSCHEFATAEYQQTIHYSNRTGVRALCADCHVPKEWIHKVVRKIKATNELYHAVLGSINTKEKFEAKRLEMAEHEWARMRATDSRECRNCHSLESMDLELQHKRARKKHDAERWAERGETCIDCHDGIAHELP